MDHGRADEEELHSRTDAATVRQAKSGIPVAGCVKGSGATDKGVAQMGWERRGNHEYYYRKEREGSRVKSTYVGRGEMAHMIAGFQSNSAELETLLRAKESIENQELERIEAAVDGAVELVQLFTEATLLTAGFHTHRRQWRRTRKCQ